MSDESAVRMEDLLAHRQWVRALARRLAADESRADDLEQETWLAAVENPPRDPRSLRGWLGTVLRNLHRNSMRGDARRGRREESVARHDVGETADDLVAEAEVQHLLVREVLDLDEPYRSTVLLRWFEDLTPQQVAERQGLPIETVRTRLKRAVERLRARMDARHGGDRRAWCLLLLGRSDGVGTGVAAGSTKVALTGAAGGMAMGAATKFTVAAALLVAIGGVAWWARSDGAPAAAPPVESASAVPSPAAKPERHAVRTEAPATAAASGVDLAKLDRDLDLHGVVVRADGSGVVGAKVQAVDYPWRRTMTMNVAAMFDGKPGASTTSADDGAFALRLRRGEATVLRVAADGLATREMGPFQAGERVRITMTPAVKLHVSVKDEAGAPVADAALWVLGFGNRGDAPWVNVRAATDAAGKCDLDGLPGGAQVGVLPLAGAGDWGMQRVTLPATGETSVDLVSPVGRTLHGRVFDAVTLAPIQDAKVGLGKGVVCATTTDGGGRFEIRGFTGKGERSVEVLAAGYSPSVVRIAADDAVEVPLRRGFAAAGRVVDVDGKAVAGAYVAVEASQRGAGPEQFSCGFAATGADGRFRVADLAREMPHVLSISSVGSGRLRQAVRPPREGDDAVDLGDVRLAAPRSIEGRVLKPDGSPSPGIDVRLVGPNVSAPGEPGSREERRTDDLGRFRFADLSPGFYSVEMQVQGGSLQAVKVTLPADRDVLDVLLPPKTAGDAIVVVVRDEAGAPLAGMNVNGSGGQSVLAKTDAAGRATLTPSAPGAIQRIDVGSQNFDDAYLRLPTILVAPGRHEYAVTLVKGARIACRLLDADGAPIARATVSVEPGERALAFSMSDADGCLKITLPRDGEYSLIFHGGVYVGDKGLPTDSLLEAREDHVTARSGEVTLRCRRVETGRTATIRVMEADGSPVADTEVRLYAWANVERKVKTDAEGRARFDNLPAHSFNASVSFRQGSLMASMEWFVPAGQEVVLKYPAAVTVTGVVLRPGGAPAVGASVNVLREEGLVFMTTADRDGRFVVQIPAGDAGPFRLEAGTMYDKVFVGAKLALSPGDRDVRIELKPSQK